SVVVMGGSSIPQPDHTSAHGLVRGWSCRVVSTLGWSPRDCGPPPLRPMHGEGNPPLRWISSPAEQPGGKSDRSRQVVHARGTNRSPGTISPPEPPTNADSAARGGGERPQGSVSFPPSARGSGNAGPLNGLLVP